MNALYKSKTLTYSFDNNKLASFVGKN